MQLNVDDVVFRDDLYPRIAHDPALVQKYADSLEILPPIEVNQNNELIDGWHRWTAHKKKGASTLEAKVTPTGSEAEFLELAITRNAKHGLQMSNQDKRKMAIRIYDGTPASESAAKKRKLAEILSVALWTVTTWLSDIDKTREEERNATICQMWLACNTEQEIADAVGLSKMQINRVCNLFQEFGISYKPFEFDDIEDEEERKIAIRDHYISFAYHGGEFSHPLYALWSFGSNANEVEHFGNTHVGIVDNLLKRYTLPFSVVCDPFAGGGSTIDICKHRLRRYMVSDLNPIVEREHEIRRHDVLTDGPLKPPHWGDVSLVYLDPP